MKVAVALVTHNRPDLLRRTLASLPGAGISYTLDLVDNGSTDPESIQIVRERGGITNYGECHLPALGFNIAIEAALSHKPDLVVCGPDDVEFRPGAIARLVELWENAHPAVGIISYFTEPLYRWNTPYGCIEIGPKHDRERALLRIIEPAFWSFPPSTWARIGPFEVKRYNWEKEACYRLRDAGLLACCVDLSEHIGWLRSTSGNDGCFYTQGDMGPVWRSWGVAR